MGENKIVDAPNSCKPARQKEMAVKEKQTHHAQGLYFCHSLTSTEVFLHAAKSPECNENNSYNVWRRQEKNACRVNRQRKTNRKCNSQLPCNIPPAVTKEKWFVHFMYTLYLGLQDVVTGMGCLRASHAYTWPALVLPAGLVVL